MKRTIVFFLFFSLVFLGNLFCQLSNIIQYQELPNPVAPNDAAWSKISDLQIGWGNTDTRYKKEGVPNANFTDKTISLRAWKGEKVSCQWVAANNGAEAVITYQIGAIQHIANNDVTIMPENIYTGFVRYVMTDELNKAGAGGCGARNKKDFDSTLVADVIDHHATSITLKKMQTQPVWVAINVPQTAEVGDYMLKIDVVNNGTKVDELTVKLTVIDEILPTPQNWKFHLDLWQNPFAVARIYNVPLWSEQHLELLRKEMKRYADAGGKIITASLIHKPWNGQTYDYFEGMVKWVKKTDGTWSYDFTVFDKWVQLMMDLGVDKQINCFSMIPWHKQFRYFDQASNSYKTLTATSGTTAYANHWNPFLKAFATHLKEKKWFEITHIAMDERPMEEMLATLKVIRNAEPGFKVSLAGAYHTELVDELDDYCVALRMKFTEKQIEKRRADNKVTTFYTSCEEPYPNTFTFSNPADCEWFGWYAAKTKLDGYLRWAINSWVQNPLQDSRFRSWAAGDTYLLYPGERSSLRFERMIAGIQAFEKINILRNRFEKDGKISHLMALERIFTNIDENKLSVSSSHIFINAAKRSLEYLVETQNNVLKDELKRSINEAKTIKTTDFPIGTNPGEYDAEKWNELQQVIHSAEVVLNDEKATQKSIDQQLVLLLKAVETFKSSANPPFEISNDERTVWYQIADRRTPVSYVYRKDVDVVANQLKWTTQNLSDSDDQLFRFEKAENNSYKIYNKTYPTYPVSIAKNDNSCIAIENNPSNDTWLIMPSIVKGYYYIQFAQGDESMRLNSYRSHNDKIGFWGPAPNDMGNQWTFIKHTFSGVPQLSHEVMPFYVENRRIYTSGNAEQLSLYNLSGQEIDSTMLLEKGIYVVKIDGVTRNFKILIY